ncbi:MAG TPA: multidrug effflux MFS transporter [Steroidobacteraceae bacterium]|jgi:DHA1 family bicyclomycin/chloramphenicol resistance-like MFS transporter|nr:multidrug effflux MFS transporter [Steroidobacteraceae bacterium]
MSERLPAPTTRIPFTEFVVLIAALMACQAIAIDAMLPALSTIGQALGLTQANRLQWVVLAYMAGLGCGQLVWGLFSDRYGRRRILLIGLGLYVLAALLCSTTTSFNVLLGVRFVHGAAAASLVVTRSVIRDRYSGPVMARVMSLSYIVFLTSPVVAPSLGQLVLLAASWRYVFVMIGGFAVLVWCWLLLRLPETLHPEYRLRLSRGRIAHAAGLVLGNRSALCYTLAGTCVMGALLAYLGMVQQILSEIFRRPRLLPAVFSICAGSMGVTSYLNSRLVERLGMRVISHCGLLLLLAVAGLHVLLSALGVEGLVSFSVLQAVTLACIGLTAANFSTLAMEPMGAVAGIAASLQGFISMLGGALLAALIGRQFSSSTLPLAVGTAVCSLGGLVFVLTAERGRLFRGWRDTALQRWTPGRTPGVPLPAEDQPGYGE